MNDDVCACSLSGMVEVHLHELIQAMMVIDVLPLSMNHKQVATLYLEFAFMYGAMGFHYSTQVSRGMQPLLDGVKVHSYELTLLLGIHDIKASDIVMVDIFSINSIDSIDISGKEFS